jgi:PAS domain S-box-containing protein
LFTARLSRRIVFWVFVSIVAIEAIILIPSVYRREQELLRHLKDLSMARANELIEKITTAEPTDAELLSEIQQLMADPRIAGVALYKGANILLGAFGEVPQLDVAVVRRNPDAELLDRSAYRYDAAWSIPAMDDSYVLIVRHNATSVRGELIAFIGRITGLVVIISVFVTIATMVVLESLVITPILTLRRDLLRAGEATRNDEPPPQFYSQSTHRRDELGEVISAFNQMFNQVTEAIAERKQAESALRLSEEKFSKAFHSAPSPVMLTTVETGQFVEVNTSFLRVFGYDTDEVIGSSIQKLGLLEHPDEWADMIKILKSGDRFRNQERLFRTKTGAPRTILMSSELIMLNGRDCVLSVTNDITERKAMEEVLRQSEMRFRTVVEQAADALFLINHEGEIVDVNQYACEVLGYERDELIGQQIQKIQKSLMTEQLQEIEHSADQGHPVTSLGVYQRKDGTSFPVEVRTSSFEWGGSRLRLSLARDITERKQTQKALERLAEIGELAAMVVHEVRNPLTTVLMGLNSFKRMELPERALARLELALEEGDRLQRLLSEILLYAKRQALTTIEIDLNQFLAEILETIRALPAAMEITLEFEPTQPPVLIKGDRDKLKQVFINLLENACEAVKPGECVSCTIIPDIAHERVCIQVHNEGEPIPPEILPKLTKPFFTTKSTGNGLGLAIVKRIVESHGGEFTIESTAEAGTTVSVVLPIVADPNDT